MSGTHTVAALAASASVYAFTATAAASAQEVTYARDVAPILQAHCQECHTEGSITPLHLTNYDEARRYALRIRPQVADRIMPPWHVDRTVGIQEFANDRGLSDEDLATILAWVDGGTPFGKREDLPEAPELGDPLVFRLATDFGEPDLVVASRPYPLDSVPRDEWFRTTTATGLSEARWVKAIEIRPVGAGARKVVHHARAFLQQDEGTSEYDEGLVGTGPPGSAMGRPGLFTEWAVGAGGEVFPDDAGKLMRPGASIRWEVHLIAGGAPAEGAAVEIGVWFRDDGDVPEHRIRSRMFDARGPTGLDIPPGQVAVTQQYHNLRWPTRLESFRPHMHMRGKIMQIEAVYPDGGSEILSRVDRFQWRWPVNYVYADHAAPLLPAGTTLIVTAWHDNTAENPNNPDPRQWVGWGDRPVDEMAHAWIDVTYLSREEFDAAVAGRRPPG